MKVEMHGCWYELPWYIRGYTYSMIDGQNRVDFRLAWPLRLIVWLLHITGVRETGTLERSRPMRYARQWHRMDKVETYAPRGNWLRRGTW